MEKKIRDWNVHKHIKPAYKRLIQYVNGKRKKKSSIWVGKTWSIRKSPHILKSDILYWNWIKTRREQTKFCITRSIRLKERRARATNDFHKNWEEIARKAKNRREKIHFVCASATFAIIQLTLANGSVETCGNRVFRSSTFLRSRTFSRVYTFGLLRRWRLCRCFIWNLFFVWEEISGKTLAVGLFTSKIWYKLYIDTWRVGELFVCCKKSAK